VGGWLAGTDMVVACGGAALGSTCIAARGAVCGRVGAAQQLDNPLGALTCLQGEPLAVRVGVLFGRAKGDGPIPCMQAQHGCSMHVGMHVGTAGMAARATACGRVR
jgi:hypothetical protein